MLHNTLMIMAACWITLVSPAQAASEAYFFKGQTIRIIVGYGAGGGFDTLARTFARHVGRHIPGHPTVIVHNMSGAGGAVAFNYVYNKARPDGLTWVTSDAALVFSRILELPGPRFDVNRFPWLGAAMSAPRACLVMERTGINSTHDFLNTDQPLRIAATAPGDAVHLIPTVMQKTLGANFKIILGYGGTAEMLMALQTGEADGMCSSWSSMKRQAADLLASREAMLVLQIGTNRQSDLPEIPNIFDLSMSAEAETILCLVISPSTIAKLYATAPGIPETRLYVLQEAFSAVLEDPLFLKEAQRLNLPIFYTPPDEIQRIISEMEATPTELKKRVAAMVKAR